MKIKGSSDFHRGLSVTFTGIKAGVNIRKLRGKRSRYCLDYSSSNSHVCGCGFPVGRTSWECPNGYVIESVHTCDWAGGYYGRGYLSIVIRAT
jgi:hypothetical protein